MEKIITGGQEVVLLNDLKFVIERSKIHKSCTIMSYTNEEEPKILDRFYNVILEDDTFTNIEKLYNMLSIYNDIIKEVCEENEITDIDIDFSKYKSVYYYKNNIKSTEFTAEITDIINTRLYEILARDFDGVLADVENTLSGIYILTPIYNTPTGCQIYIFFTGPYINPYRGLLIHSEKPDTIVETVTAYMRSDMAQLYHDIIEAAEYDNYLCDKIIRNLNEISNISLASLEKNLDFINIHSAILDTINRRFKYNSIEIFCDDISKEYNVSPKDYMKDANKYKLEFYNEFKNKIFKLAVISIKGERAIDKYLPYSKKLKDMVCNPYNYSLKECDTELKNISYVVDLVKGVDVEKYEDGTFAFCIIDAYGEKIISRKYQTPYESGEETMLYMKLLYALGRYGSTSKAYIKALENFPGDIKELFDIFKKTSLKPSYKK